MDYDSLRIFHNSVLAEPFIPPILPGQRLLEAIAESVLDMTDEEVLEECRAAGQDPEVVADRMDAAARQAVDIHTKESK